MTTMQIVWLAIATLLPSWLISCAVVELVRRLAPRWGLLDKPNARKNHISPIPLGGGLGIWAGLVGSFLLGSLVVLATDSAYLLEFLPMSFSNIAKGFSKKPRGFGG